MKKLSKKIKVKSYKMINLYNGEVGALNNCNCNTKVGCQKGGYDEKEITESKKEHYVIQSCSLWNGRRN